MVLRLAARPIASVMLGRSPPSGANHDLGDDHKGRVIGQYRKAQPAVQAGRALLPPYATLSAAHPQWRSLLEGSLAARETYTENRATLRKTALPL